MSSYRTKAVLRKTGQVVEILCLDDYFGRREYGYCDGGEVMTEKEFNAKYTVNQ